MSSLLSDVRECQVIPEDASGRQGMPGDVASLSILRHILASADT